MYLFKCSCGCFFTMKQLSERPICPNCNEVAVFDSETRICRADEKLQEANMTMQIIPDTAKINISFDV